MEPTREQGVELCTRLMCPEPSRTTTTAAALSIQKTHLHEQRCDEAAAVAPQVGQLWGVKEHRAGGRITQQSMLVWRH
jgi:hypothetical protein